MNVVIPSHSTAIRTCRAAADGNRDALEALQNVAKNHVEPTMSGEHMVLRVIHTFLSTRKRP